MSILFSIVLCVRDEIDKLPTEQQTQCLKTALSLGNFVDINVTNVTYQYGCCSFVRFFNRCVMGRFKTLTIIIHTIPVYTLSPSSRFSMV